MRQKRRQPALVGIAATWGILILWTQSWEQNDVANRIGIGQEHDESVDADAATGRGRQAVFERLDEIVVHWICFFVALEFFLDLVEEALTLVEWVVELVKGVAELDTADEDFESIDEIFIDVVSARKRANACGVFIDKRRLDERLFDALFEDFHQKVSVALFGELFAANRFRQVCNDVFEEAAIGEFCFVNAEDLVPVSEHR